MPDRTDTEFVINFTADQVNALDTLLSLVHYDNLAQEWRNMLPGELLDAMKTVRDRL